MTENKFNRQTSGSRAECDGASGAAAEERLWQAWRYVAGELDADERSAFEDLLAECQDAREAVAAAVEMVQLLRVAEAESMPVTAVCPAGEPPRGSMTTGSGAASRDAGAIEKQAPGAWGRGTGRARHRGAGARWSGRLSWMVMGAAASLLLVVGLRMVPSLLVPATTESPVVSLQQQAELALAWSQARDRMLSELADEDRSLQAGGDDLPASNTDRELADTAGMTTFLQPDPMSGVAAPDWMMAALRAEAGDAGATPPEDGEEI